MRRAGTIFWICFLRVGSVADASCGLGCFGFGLGRFLWGPVTVSDNDKQNDFTYRQRFCRGFADNRKCIVRQCKISSRNIIYLVLSGEKWGQL